MEREDVNIHRVTPDEVPDVIELFIRELYPGDRESAERHLQDHVAGEGATFIAYASGKFAGHVTIRWTSHNPDFQRNNVPLIHDLNVFEQFQRRGIGSLLMDAAETLIATRANTAGITVGIFDAYGAAQRLYARRGYLTDGRGVCQAHRPLRLADVVTVDHDLIIWMTKDLRS